MGQRYACDQTRFETSLARSREPLSFAGAMRGGHEMRRYAHVAGSVLLVGVLAVVALSAAGAASPAGSRQARWVITDLGTLPGMSESEAVAINNRGQAVGNSHRGDSGQASRAFLWQAGRMSDLGTLGGRFTSVAALNGRGQAVGWSATRSGAKHAVLWERGRVHDLGVLPGRKYSHAVAINEHGQIIGDSSVTDGVDATVAAHAFLWQDGKLRDLGTLGGISSHAKAINEEGQIVGWSTTDSGEGHAFLWQKGIMTDLGTLPGRPNSEAVAINNRGQIIGNARTDTGGSEEEWTPFLWQRGQIAPLATLASGLVTAAFAINERGNIVGESQDANDTFHAILWRDRRMTDLGRLGRPKSQRNYNSSAYTLNNRGVIIGASDTDNGSRAFLWQDGKITDLGTLGGAYSYANAINERNQIVGTSATGTGRFTDYPRHAVLWTLRSAA